MTTYLDCNATTPIEPEVLEIIVKHMRDEYGNAGSRTHELGNAAKKAVQRARDQVAAVVGASRDEVIFTSGATESNNLALLGLRDEGLATGRKHVISTQIEHKAVLEPLAELAKQGFEVTLLRPNDGGWVEPGAIREALRPDTLLVSVMQANNETGILQPIAETAAVLGDSPAWFHVDAAQGFGKEFESIRLPRVDLISVSGHKIYGPKGVGALVARRRGFSRPPLRPLVFGGGQEYGLRPGTVPVPLVAGLGLAAELAVRDHEKRRQRVLEIRSALLSALAPMEPVINGESSRCLPHCVNLSFPGLDSEAVMVAWRGLVACSNGSACTSHKYEPSHVLGAMGLAPDAIQQALRLSWCHLTTKIDLEGLVSRVRALR